MRLFLTFVLLLATFPAKLAAEDTREKTLPNGLKIIVHPMHGAPLVTVMTMYRVGSVNESEGQSGITHLCEHMLFKGSRNYPDGEACRLAGKLGGYVNGFTQNSNITFFQIVPKERLLDFLDRHADAMENATFDPAEYAKEMVVVRSELEGDENDPSWLLRRAVQATMFQTHGMHHPVIGWREDVERITPEQLKGWYRAHFRPNNAVVIVVGDVDADKAVEEVEKRFGAFAPGTVPFEPSAEPPQQGELRVTVRAPSSVPLVEVAYHNVPTGHVDSFALEVAQEMLGKGQRSRLYRALVEKGLASDVEVGNFWGKYPSIFEVTATGVPGADTAAIEKAIVAEMDRLAIEDVPADEVARCIRQIVRERAFSLDATEKVATEIANFEAWSSWRYALAFGEEVAKVTPARVKEAARKYFVRDNRTTGVLLPETKSASPDLTKARAEVDRAPKSSAKPAATATKPAPPVEFTLSNGIRVLYWANPSSPTFALKARWPGGYANSAQGPGTASMTLEMLHEGTVAHDKGSFDELLEARGSTIATKAAFEYAEASITGMQEDFEATAGLMAEFLEQPRWPDEAFAVVKDRVIARMVSEPDDMEGVGYRAIRHALFAPGHPRYSATLEEDLAATRKVTLAELRGFHASHCVPKSLVVAISGAIDEATARKVAQAALGGWKSEAKAPSLVFPGPREKFEEKPIIILFPGKSEAWGGVAIPCPVRPTDPDYPAFDILNQILGGGALYSSRLCDRIRVRNGLVYDTYSSYTWTQGNSYFYAQFGSNPENVDKAMALLRSEIQTIHDVGVTEEEVANAISYALGAYPMQTETAEAKAGEMLDLSWFGAGLDFTVKRQSAYRAVTKAQVDAAAKKYLDPSRMIEVIAGTYEEKK